MSHCFICCALPTFKQSEETRSTEHLETASESCRRISARVALETRTTAGCGLVDEPHITLGPKWSSVDSIRVTSAKSKKEISGELRLHVGLLLAQTGARRYCVVASSSVTLLLVLLSGKVGYSIPATDAEQLSVSSLYHSFISQLRTLTPTPLLNLLHAHHVWACRNFPGCCSAGSSRFGWLPPRYRTCGHFHAGKPCMGYGVPHSPQNVQDPANKIKSVLREYGWRARIQ